MKTKELIEYLSQFDTEIDVCVVVANPPKRIKYETVSGIIITDSPVPAFGIEVGDAIPFDEEETKVAEECEEENE